MIQTPHNSRTTLVNSLLSIWAVESPNQTYKVKHVQLTQDWFQGLWTLTIKPLKFAKSKLYFAIYLGSPHDQPSRTTLSYQINHYLHAREVRGALKQSQIKIRGKKTWINQIFSNGLHNEPLDEIQYFQFSKNFFHTSLCFRTKETIDLNASYNFAL